MRRRLAQLLRSATATYERSKNDASRIATAARRRTSISLRGFSGSADTWPPVVRKPEGRPD